VPTSYYSAVQLTCHAEIADDLQRKAELLRRQIAHFQLRGDHAQVGVDMPPYGRMLSGIRGLRLHIASVGAKFKHDDHDPQEHRARVAERLESRGSGRDHSAAAQ
jgi:transcriptional regulator